MTTPKESTLKQPRVGDQAPAFTVQAYPNGTINLADYRGKKNVILAFYPKDDTPGCTKEMCAFSEDLSHFENAQTEVLGISCDTVDSHEKFAGKFSLKQKLLADPKGETARNYGVLQEEKGYASRVLFVIDKNGIVQYVHEGIPENKQLIEVLQRLK